jgi:DNA invertase Pin-like site-specific DNA recombinase
MIRVAIYCRVSTDFDVSLKSLENQILAYIDLVQNNPDWHLQGIYSDRGISGTSIKRRTSFQRMLRHCEEGKIDLIITKSISRFSRNTHDLLGILRKLRQLNIDIIFEKEGIRMSEADNEFILTMYAAIAQQEAVNISQNISWAYRRRALAGIPKFRRLYGYRVVGSGQDQMLEPIPEEAEVVRKIFDMYLSGHNCSAIIRQLAKDGVQTMKGESVWSKNNIKRLLTNIKYTGNSKIVKKPSRLSELQINSPDQNEPILINNSHPAIISQELFDAVQDIINAKYTPRSVINQTPMGNILVGRIQCAHCGANYVLFKRINDDKIHVCATRRKSKGSCPSTFIKESQILDLMKQAIQIRYMTDNQQTVRQLRSDLVKSCNLDQSEEDRLSRIIDIARLGQQILSTSNNSHLIQKKNNLEQDFQEFEQNLELAEQDLAIRVKLTNNLPESQSLESFIRTITTENGCALIPAIKLYSSNDAVMTWHDQRKTVIGNCQPAMISIQQSIDKTEQTETTSTATETRVVLPANEKAVIAQTTLQTGQLLSSLQFENNRKLRVCAYCRTSTAEEQHISSLSRQIASYTYVIMTNPDYEFAGIYSDHAKSGLNITNRSGFQQMLDDARSGKFDLIITKSVSRFGRNVVDVLATVRELKALPNPVIVLFENESLRSDSPQCDFMLSLHSAVAQNEAYSTSESIRWSNIKTIKNGTYKQSGKLPFGYSKTNSGQWIVNDAEAAVIRQIFNEYINGKSSYAIAADLTNDQIPNSSGGQLWRPTTVYMMVNNITYIGHFLHGRLFRPDLTSNKRRTNRGEVDQYLIENHHPAIIDQDTWERAQAVSASRKRAKSNRVEQTDLDGKIAHRQNIIKKIVICGICGKAVFHRRHTYKQQVYSYWKCIASIKSIKHELCNLKSIRQEIIEHAIMICLLRMKHNNDWQRSAAIYCNNFKQNSTLDESLELLKSQEAVLYAKIYECVRTEQEQSTHLIDQITTYTEQLLAINSQINELEHNKKFANEKILYISNLGNILVKVPDFDPSSEIIEFRDDIFEKLFKSVEIFNNSTIRCNLVFDYSETITVTETNLHKLQLK